MTRPLLSALLAALAVACSSDDTPRVIDQPAEGTAFPAAPLGFSWPTGPYGLVSNNGSDTVSVVDLQARAVVGTLRVGLDPVDNDGPHHLAFDRARGQLFVALAYPAPALSPGPHAAHGSASRPGKVVRLDVPSGQLSGQMRADANPGDIVLSDDGARLVVSHFDLQRALSQAAKGPEAQRASLLVYDTSDFRADASPRDIPVCITPHGLALSRPDARFAYVACNGEDAIAVVDLSQPDPAAAVTRVPVGPAPGSGGVPRYGPYAAVLAPDNRQLLVGNTEGRDLRVFDTSTLTMASGSLDAPGAVYFAAANATSTLAYVPVQTPDALLRVALPSLAQQAYRPLDSECVRPHEAVLWNQDSELLLVCEGDHVTPGALLFLDPATLATRARIELGVYPDKILVVTP